MLRQYELVERVKAYDPDANEALLNRAYVFATKMHGSQLRASGDPYFSHPIEVAGILTDLKLDSASIATALLHDTVEDTPATLEDIEKQFGEEVARLVNGVTKLTRLELQSEQTKQAENLRKLVLAMSEDVRVLLVKLADRTHNMRTLHFIQKPEKRKRIARETLDIYVPLADRIGLNRLKDELQDLAFAELNADARESILTRLKLLRTEGQDVVGRIITELSELMREAGVQAQVSGREKSAFSIWQKMQKKDIPFEQLSDIMAFRIVVPTIEQCYQALGCIHARYPMMPGRFKDYLSTPKPNGYKSIHTTVIGPLKHRVEVQIRTLDMHTQAEMGVAAHWAYKQGKSATDGKEYQWLRQLRDIVDNAQRPEEFLEHTKLELFQDQVFCFTPKGDLISLPHGATPIDFAYSVHSAIGNMCVGAKVNGRLVPLRTVLRNGDQVEIHTSSASTPKEEWERIVATGKARAHIRRFFRNKHRTEFLALGRRMLESIFKAEGYELTEKVLDGVCKQFNLTEAEDVIVAVGQGTLSAKEVFRACFPMHRNGADQAATEEQKLITLPARARSKVMNEHGQPVAIKGLIDGMAVKFARCCHPIPGDRIVGIINTGTGVTIHTIDCDTLENFADTPERWLDLTWDHDGQAAFTSRVHLFVLNSPGSLGALSTTIGKNGGNITNLKFTNRTSDYFEMDVDVEVSDVKHLNNIIAALRATSGVQTVERSKTN